jgi:hypothetical protein
MLFIKEKTYIIRSNDVTELCNRTKPFFFLVNKIHRNEKKTIPRTSQSLTPRKKSSMFRASLGDSLPSHLYVEEKSLSSSLANLVSQHSLFFLYCHLNIISPLMMVVELEIWPFGASLRAWFSNGETKREQQQQ